MFRAAFILSLILIGCSSNPPLQEYTLAKTALDAAQSSGAPKYAPGLWFKAEENYRKGETSFRKGQYEEALIFFDNSINFSERAENKTKYDKRRLGEELP